VRTSACLQHHSPAPTEPDDTAPRPPGATDTPRPKGAATPLGAETGTPRGNGATKKPSPDEPGGAVAELEKSEGSAAPRCSAASEEGESKRERSAPPTASRRASKTLLGGHRQTKNQQGHGVITVSDLPLKGKRQSARLRTRWLSKKVSSPCCTNLEVT